MNRTLPKRSDARDESEDTLALLRDVASARQTLNSLYPRLARIASSEGHSLRAIGDAAGVHRTTIYAIVKGDDAA